MNQPLQELTLDAANDTIESIPATAREMLEMDIAYVAQFTDGQQVFRHLDGDSRSFGVEPDQSMPLEGTYCQRMVEGDISNVVEDAPAIEALACLPVTETAAIGSYIGVPIHLSSGELYGTLCCLDHDTNHALAAREVRFMHVLGRLVAQALERKETDERLSRMRSQAQGLEALLAALGARDNYTGEHVQAVVGLAVGCARRIGLPEAKVGEIEQVALLHDIGKVGIADSILSKPGPLMTRNGWR